MLGVLAYGFFAGIVGEMADSRERSFVLWFLLAIFTTPLLAGILLVILGGKNEI